MGPLHSLWLVVMAAAALANPLGLNNRREIDRRAVILCSSSTTCETTDGKSACVPDGGQCGPVVCERGLHCCNPSCGICTKPGQGCTKQACGPPCGKKLCAYGEVCCNDSCGYCRKPGEPCTMELCQG